MTLCSMVMSSVPIPLNAHSMITKKIKKIKNSMDKYLKSQVIKRKNTQSNTFTQKIIEKGKSNNSKSSKIKIYF